VTEKMTDNARETHTNDGGHHRRFQDRGDGSETARAGEFFGTKQSGIPGLQIANLVRDREILELAKDEATAFVNAPPTPEEFETGPLPTSATTGSAAMAWCR